MASLRIALLALGWITLLAAGAYGYTVVMAPSASNAANNPSITINAAGATLAYPLLSAVGASFTQTYPNVLINYQPEGSVFGIREFTLKHVDFAATYPPLNDGQRKAAPNALHIPESISAVAISYNIPGVPGGLNLTGPLLAEIYLYNITRWSDPAIQNLNPNTQLPDKTIITFHNSEPEGTTFVFTTFLSIVSRDWNIHVGNGTDVSWKGTGASVPLDSGVASYVKTTPNSIGYMELSYALQSGLTYASIQNGDQNNFVAPSEESAAAASTNLNKTLPNGDQNWSRVNLLLEPGLNSYPLVTFTYLLIYKELSVVPSMDIVKGTALANFIWYLVHDGQSLGAGLGYVPLPPQIVTINEASIKSITFQGKALFTS